MKKAYDRRCLGLVCAVACAGLPLQTMAQETASPFTPEQGYLIQVGVSLGALALSDDDRVQHVAAGSAISAFVTSKTGSFWKGCAAALAAGMMKEFYDEVSNTGRAEARDIGYTVAGCSFTLRF